MNPEAIEAALNAVLRLHIPSLNNVGGERCSHDFSPFPCVTVRIINKTLEERA